MQSLAEISVSSYKPGDEILLSEKDLFESYGTNALRMLWSAAMVVANRHSLEWSVDHHDGEVRVKFWERGV
jgi:hypothetical protein